MASNKCIRSSLEFRSWDNAVDLRVLALLPLYCRANELIIRCWEQVKKQEWEAYNFYAGGKKSLQLFHKTDSSSKLPRTTWVEFTILQKIQKTLDVGGIMVAMNNNMTSLITKFSYTQRSARPETGAKILLWKWAKTDWFCLIFRLESFSNETWSHGGPCEPEGCHPVWG